MKFSSLFRSSLLVASLSAVVLVPGSAQTAAPAPKAARRPLQLRPPAAPDPAVLNIAPGFKVEQIYSVPKADQGSWVSLTIDTKGRLLASDQYGGIYRITLPAIGTTDGTKVERLAVSLEETTAGNPRTAKADAAAAKAGGSRIDVGAHGLLYAFDSLYVMNNERPQQKGLWRLRDTDGDDQFDEVTYLREMKGGGEHGTHSLVLSPDGKSIYFANGNHTDLPKSYELTRQVAWGEDHLLPRMWDPRGHARNKFAPGGYIGRTDPDGKTVEIYTIGFRNQFDIAFDQNGELFTYDSDMEWDQGSPWYVPTRINHAVDGGDFGWRSGAGRWPSYYADSLPSGLDIGPGCPTGLTFGTHAKFPAKYQRAMFACDWTFGTMYAISFTPDGATYRGHKEEFLSGKPLPLTDLLINPNDGAMYFIVGGRRTQSALYRVTYTGPESTAPAGPAPLNEAAKLRRSLEALHAEGTGPGAIDTAWPHLASPDRFIRFAARVAIERQPAEKWAKRALAELNPQAAIEALIALARVGDKSLQPQLIDALSHFKFNAQPENLRLPLLRAWELTFTRMGKPTPEVCARVAAEFEPLFPHPDQMVTRELLSLLIFLDSPTVVAKAVPLLKIAEPPVQTPEELGGHDLIARNDGYGAVVKDVSAHRSDRQQISIAYSLRNATVGWTPALRTAYFSWFPTTSNWRGGASFEGFLRNTRNEALANTVSDPAERERLSKVAGMMAPPPVASAPVAPTGPGRNYTVAEAVSLVDGKLSGRDYAHGRAMFTSAGCVMCHKFNDQGGGGVGPDLSGAASRYSVRDLLENIIEPSLVISEFYGSERFELKSGGTLVGKMLNEESNAVNVMINPFAPDVTQRVPLADIKSRTPNPVSLMPQHLVDALNPDELGDLVAYLLSGGNTQDKMFKR